MSATGHLSLFRSVKLTVKRHQKAKTRRDRRLDVRLALDSGLNRIRLATSVLNLGRRDVSMPIAARSREHGAVKITVQITNIAQNVIYITVLGDFYCYVLLKGKGRGQC